MIELHGRYTDAKIMIDNVEPEVISQVYGVINHPIFNGKKIRIMPDCHSGKGCVIGFTAQIDLINPQIIPNLIGVDIGCGVLSVNIGQNLSLSIEEINKRIIETIPMGFSVNNKPKARLNKHVYEPLCKKISADYNRVLLSLGTLGGGNHFIELGRDIWGFYRLTIHTGSRNLGKCVCDYHQKRAFDYISKIGSVPIEEFKKKYSGLELGKKIEEFNKNKPKVDKDLCYLEGCDAREYLNDMKLAQEYATLNRETIVSEILKACGFSVEDKTESVHNYIDFNDGILRKGAIRSYKGERNIVPFNMRDGILFCQGLSNEDWNCSAPHGAGRIMSRSKAKEMVSLDDFKESMKNVYSTCVGVSTLDESPMAYKDSKIIEEAIKDTCIIVEKVKPVLNIKAGGE